MSSSVLFEISDVPASRAAQYVRVSTDMQRYSIENQAGAIAAYAARRNISIVRTYSDVGRSGVRIAGRTGLQDLLRDVQRKNTDFDSILVYDISRWGRFQDVDESAYYEFICKQAGIGIHYCADDFENDGSLASIILKNIKRVAAADYSKQLSKKVFLGQSRSAGLGHWRGGPAPFGLRRMLLDEKGNRKTLLQYGERKNLKTEHTILVPGPKSEVKTLNWIFTTFATKKMTRTEIAAALNAKGLKNSVGKSWTMFALTAMLKNEAYLGNVVYNRRSKKIGEKKAMANPRDMWIRRDGAFEPIISAELFKKTQEVFEELKGGRSRSDEKLLSDLSDLLKKEGRLTLKIMQDSKGLANSGVYLRRFGSLAAAYKKVGYEPEKRYDFGEIQKEFNQIICDTSKSFALSLEKCGMRVDFMPELYLLTINQSMRISVGVARAISNGVCAIKTKRWEARSLRFKRSDLTLIVRMDEQNQTIKDYFLIPTPSLKATVDGRIRVSDFTHGSFRHEQFGELVKSAADYIRLGYFSESITRSA